MDRGSHQGVSDPGDCCNLCNSRSGCTTWTVFEGNCYLKNGQCENKKSYDPDRAISGGNGFNPSPSPSPSPQGRWEPIDASGVTPNGKDEAGYYEWNGALCMFGGRFRQPVDCFHPDTETWTRAKTYTDDLHHLQPVVWNKEVYVVAAWHGAWPDNEKNVKKVVIYNPEQDTLRTGADIPSEFQRGGAGCVLYDDLIYVAQGASNGHLAQYGAEAFSGMSSFNPATGEWKALSAPRYNRDHYDAVVIGSSMVIASGRDTPRGCTSGKSGDIDCSGKPNIFHYTVGPAEIYDFGTGKWRESSVNIPHGRAGAMSIVDQHVRMVVLGGESDLQQKAFVEVEAYDLDADAWTSLPAMNTGRHTGGVELYTEDDGRVRMIAALGVGKMGGDPKLADAEKWVQSAVQV